MNFTMGGREFELTPEDVRRRMKKVQPEPFQKYVVELNGAVYPPKQVIDTCLGFPRTSFTTMEAQRVLSRLGFVCRRAATAAGGTEATGDADRSDSSSATQSALTTLQLAVARLDERVKALEEGRT